MRRLIPLTLLCALGACDDDTSAADGPEADSGTQDMAPPANLGLEIAAPMPGAFVLRRVMVSGKVTGVGPDQAPQVQVNGVDAQMTGYDFTAEVILDPGPQTIVATAAGLQAEVEVIVDDTPPRIDIHAPARGTYIPEGQTTLNFSVTEDHALNRLTLDERDLDTALAPDYDLLGVALAPGLNIMQLEASDAAGNSSREHVAALHGPLRDPDEPIDSAIRAHIGVAGLAALGRVAAGLLDDQDLTELVPELLNESGFEISVSTIDYRRPAEITLTPRPEVLDLAVVMRQFVLELELSIGGRDAYSVGVGAGRIEVGAQIVPRVVDGELVTEIQDLQVDFFDLDFEFGGLPEFEANPEDGQNLLEEIVSDVLSEIVRQQLPDVMDQLLSRLAEPIDLELLGAILQLRLQPNVVVVSERGLSVRIDVQVALSNPAPMEPRVDGYLGQVSAWDGVPATENFGLAVDDDLLNCVLYQVWRAGVLFPTIDQTLVREQGNSLNFVSAFFGTLVTRARPEVPRDAPLRTETSLPLPIVAGVRKGATGVGLELGIGDLLLQIITDDADGNTLLTGRTSVRFNGELSGRSENGLKLALEIGEVVSAFDVLDADLRGRIENDIEGQIGELIALLGPAISEIVSDFELPTIDLVTIRDIALDAGGPDGDFILVVATLGD